MSKRLQVVLDEQELDDIRKMADRHGLTVSEWVRQTLRAARRQRASGDAPRKLATVRAAARHHFPTGDIDQMLEEIERGYEDR
ncbi:plasmid mobilization protein [Iamia sp.]|uniref:plasmid mobilization protein n=1 Tax=Iamia sp. TaxID=2722710 RepID=UPI002D01108F|nr:hypothetical protein [Iamia sp.]HXH59055.1 hypothetical protein [Iamia sp.]